VTSAINLRRAARADPTRVQARPHYSWTRRLPHRIDGGTPWREKAEPLGRRTGAACVQPTPTVAEMSDAQASVAAVDQRNASLVEATRGRTDLIVPLGIAP
jgi:hypothetical protein